MIWGHDLGTGWRKSGMYVAIAIPPSPSQLELQLGKWSKNGCNNSIQLKPTKWLLRRPKTKTQNLATIFLV